MGDNWSEIKKELKDDLKEIINLTSANTDQKLDTISESIKGIKNDMIEFKAAQKSDVDDLKKRVDKLEKKEGEKAKSFLASVFKSVISYFTPVLLTAFIVGFAFLAFNVFHKQALDASIVSYIYLFGGYNG